ncbi:MAG: DUF5658 family protein [Planctomycetota bacterium]
MEALKRISTSCWDAARHHKFPLEIETTWFVVASALDFAMTFMMLRHQEIVFVESNPIALFFINHWGIKGLLCFKLSIVAFVSLICQVIARENLQLGRRVLFLGTAIVAAVVVYSVLLHQAATRAMY